MKNPDSTLLNSLRPHLSAGRTYCVGLSGGPDSVALAHALARLAGELGFSLIALHLHHGLRGASADADEEFCHNLCQSLGITCLSQHADVQALAAAEQVSLEDAARRCRFRWFARATAAREADALFLAHHADDQAETVLLRLLRGAGVHGLAGMKPCSTFRGMTIIRPWLDVRRAEIEAYLERHALAFRTDPSNADTRHDRNWVRHDVLPLLEGRQGSDLVPRLLRTAAVCRDADDCLARRAQHDWSLTGGPSLLGLRYPRDEFRSYLPAQQSALVMHMLDLLGVERRDVKHATIDAVRTCATGRTGRVSTLPQGLLAFTAYGFLFVRRGALDAVASRELSLEWSDSVTSFCRLSLRPAQRRGKSMSHNGEAWRDLALGERVTMQQFAALPADAKLAVRARRAGDRYQPCSGVEKKVKDLLIDAGIPQCLKDSVPMVTCDGEPVWLAGWRVAEQFKVRKGERHITRLELACGQ